MDNGTFWRDDNHVPVVVDGLTVINNKIFTGSGTTVNVPMFKVTGQVHVKKLYGVVTTALLNHTAVSFRLNDQTAQTYITAVGGTSATNAPVGTIVEKNALAATAVDVDSSSTGLFEEIATANLDYYQQFRVGQKTGGIETDIEYCYTTSDTPTSGAIQFFCVYVPLSIDGNLTAL